MRDRKLSRSRAEHHHDEHPEHAVAEKGQDARARLIALFRGDRDECKKRGIEKRQRRPHARKRAPGLYPGEFKHYRR